MKKDSPIAYILYLPLSIILILAWILPRGIFLRMGRSIGGITYFLYGKRRRVALANFKAAFGDKFDDAQRKTIIKEVFRNFVMNIFELFAADRLSKQFFQKNTEVVNLEFIPEALARKKGILFLSAHYGNWEFAASISSQHGYPIYALAREQRPYFLNDLLNHRRQVWGTKIIEKGMQLREILKCLKKNGIVGIIGDQGGRQGVELDFFGRPVYIADGAFRIAAASGCVILPAFNVREQGFKHRLILEEPIVKAADEDDEAFVIRAARKYRDLLEKNISQHPHLWLWGNRRWKYSSARSVLVLDDGKTGHLRQAQAAARSIQSQCSRYKQNTVHVLFKNNICKILLDALVFILGKAVPFPVFWLKLVLNAETFKVLNDVYMDIIIATGSSTRAVALLLGKENQSKVISLMNPAPFAADLFDLAVIPYHDRPKQKENILITDGALNLVSPQYLEENSSKLRKEIALNKKNIIGLLIGGDSRDYRIDVSSVEKIIGQLKRFSEKFDAQIVLSTSRRTSAEVDDFLRKEFKGYERCVLKVFPNEKNVEYAVGGILGVSSLIVVSGESVSMVSEAASSGKPTVVFLPEKKANNKKTRHDLFLSNLESRHAVLLASPDAVFESLLCFQSGRNVMSRINDGEKLDKIIKQRVL